MTMDNITIIGFYKVTIYQGRNDLPLHMKSCSSCPSGQLLVRSHRTLIAIQNKNSRQCNSSIQYMESCSSCPSGQLLVRSHTALIALQNLYTVDGLNFVGYQFSWFSWRVRSTNSSTHKIIIFCMNYERKYNCHEF